MSPKTRVENQQQVVNDLNAKKIKIFEQERRRVEERIAKKAKHDLKVKQEKLSFERLREEINKAGGTRPAATAWDIKPTTISGWIHSTHTNRKRPSDPTRKFLRTIAEHTGCSVDWLCGFDVSRDRLSMMKSDLSTTLYSHLFSNLRMKGIPSNTIDTFLPEEKALSILTKIAYRYINQKRQKTTKSLTIDAHKIAREALNTDTLTPIQKLQLYLLLDDRPYDIAKLPSDLESKLMLSMFIEDGLNEDYDPQSWGLDEEDAE